MPGRVRSSPARPTIRSGWRRGGPTRAGAEPAHRRRGVRDAAKDADAVLEEAPELPAPGLDDDAHGRSAYHTSGRAHAVLTGRGMAYEGYECLKVRVERSVAFVTIDHPPINLFDLSLMQEIDRIGRELEADGA